MISNYLGNMSYVIDMILAAIISIFLSLLFRGGPGILYDGDRFVFRQLFWLVTIQFMGSIGVYMLVSHLFETNFLVEYRSYHSVIAFLAGLMPVEITLILLISLIHRLWIVLIKKVDPSFVEEDPLEKIKTIRSFYDENEVKFKDEEERIVKQHEASKNEKVEENKTEVNDKKVDLEDGLKP